MASLPVAILALLHVAVVISCLLVGATYYVTYHYGPEAYPAFEGAIGKEDRLPECGASTRDVDDLFVDGSFALEEAESVLGKHGVGELVCSRRAWLSSWLVLRLARRQNTTMSMRVMRVGLCTSCGLGLL